MKSILFKTFTLLLLISSAACSTIPNGPPFKKATPPTSSQSLVYFYRPDTKPWARSPDIYMNDTKVLDLKNQGYSYVYAAPGRYTIKSSWMGDTMISDRSVIADLKGGQTYFIRQYSTMDYYVVYWKTNSSLDMMNQGTALNEIQATRYVPPFVTSLNTTLAANQNFPVVKKPE